ncbi:kinase binding protein CGI-121-domain-containing protein [Macrophomina phaseolina]|uniref:EKC/KEOPS complex subunit CGI121 n=1 Tax=Macrophomina phaseolina TaxID=35725 RepID=A0ABQ8FSV3_9PEZI|nr:kinase binding protein CGI-121-domain-containing protein [Macrophomina phaseolina]
MPAVQTIVLPHLPHAPVHLALFRDVKNAAFLRRQLLDGNQAFEYAFLDATAVCRHLAPLRTRQKKKTPHPRPHRLFFFLLSTTHVLAAVFRALNDHLNARLKSRNLHSEIVFSLSPNNNIADSFRRFGVQDTTTSLLAVKVSTETAPTSAEQVESHLSESVEGTAIAFTDENLAEFTDLARIRKIYKFDAALPSQKGKNPPKNKRQTNGVTHLSGTTSEEAAPRDDKMEMEACILGIMALKGS